MTKLIVLCAGAHGRVVIDVLQQCETAIYAVTDADVSRHNDNIYGVPIIGSDEKIFNFEASEVQLVNALGNASVKIGNSALQARRDLFTKFKQRGYQFARVVSRHAVISADVVLEEGCQILTGAIIHPKSSVGANTIINTGAQLDHDNHIGPHCHIAPGAVLCGLVTVGAGCHIGARAVVVQGVKIGDNVVVGAGAVVLRDVPAGKTVLGNPARIVS